MAEGGGRRTEDSDNLGIDPVEVRGTARRVCDVFEGGRSEIVFEQIIGYLG